MTRDGLFHAAVRVVTPVGAWWLVAEARRGRRRRAGLASTGQFVPRRGIFNAVGGSSTATRSACTAFATCRCTAYDSLFLQGSVGLDSWVGAGAGEAALTGG